MLVGNMKDTYIIKVDSICSYCGYKNIINTIVYNPVDIIACGRCGKYLMLPNDINDHDKEKLNGLINKAIHGE